eukprot:3175207-Pyramimonas_sp.AAC.1
MGVTDTPRAQLCVLMKSVLALTDPPLTVSVAAVHSAQASLSRTRPLCHSSCGQCGGKGTACGISPN